MKLKDKIAFLDSMIDGLFLFELGLRGGLMGAWGFCKSLLCKPIFCGSPVVDTELRQNTCLHSGLLQKPQVPLDGLDEAHRYANQFSFTYYKIKHSCAVPFAVIPTDSDSG